VYRRSGGHSYGVTVAGPIGSIINPARDPAAHKSLPFASSLCGSCTDVCPVKIDIHQQLFLSRREIANRGLVPNSKRISIKLAAAIMARPRLYAFFGGFARRMLRIMPRWIIYNRLNVWGRQRELPPAPPKSFRELYRQQQPRGPKK